MKKKTLCLVAVPLIGLSVCVKLCAADSGEDSAVEEVVRTPQDLALACWKGSEAVRICLRAGLDPNAMYADMKQAHGDVGHKRPLWGLATARNIGTLDWKKAFNCMIRAGARLDLNVFVGMIDSGYVEQKFLDIINDREDKSSGAEKTTYEKVVELVSTTKDRLTLWHEASAYAAVIFVLYTDEHQAL